MIDGPHQLLLLQRALHRCRVIERHLLHHVDAVVVWTPELLEHFEIEQVFYILTEGAHTVDDAKSTFAQVCQDGILANFTIFIGVVLYDLGRAYLLLLLLRLWTDMLRFL